jgi:dolichol kinase
MDHVVPIGAAVTLVLVLQLFLARGSSSNDESRRRWQHAATGQVMVVVSYVLPREACLVALILACFVVIYVVYGQGEWYRNSFSTILRPTEVVPNTLPGAFYFLLGTLVATACFPLSCARYGVLCLAYSDPAAAYIGRSYPSVDLHGSASLAGCIACFVTAYMLGQIMLSSPSAIWASALACTLAEATPVLPDNFLIPVLTAATACYFEQ